MDGWRVRGLQWPCPTADHPGTAYLHAQKFSRGRGKFNAIKASDPAEQTDAEYPLILTTGRVLYHYHSGTMTRRSGPLDWREPSGYVEINAEDAEAYGLVEDNFGSRHQEPARNCNDASQDQRQRPAGNGLPGVPLARSSRQYADAGFRARSSGEDTRIQGVRGAVGSSGRRVGPGAVPSTRNRYLLQ